MFRLRGALGQLVLAIISIGYLTGCGHPESTTSRFAIIGGRPVAAGENSAAVGLLLRNPDPVGGLYLTKTCTGVRVSTTQILTAASCLSGANGNAVQLAFLVSGSGTRAASPTITSINVHPLYEAADGETSPYNVALIRLESFPSTLESSITVAGFAADSPAVGAKLKVYGAGCEKLKADDKCDGGYTILRYLKTFDTTLLSYAADTLDQKFFTTAQPDGQSVDGDQGGPVLDTQGNLVGLASYRKSDDTSDPDGKYSVYRNLADPELKSFFTSYVSNSLPAISVQFDMQPVETINGSFLAVGSYPTVNLSDSLLDFELNFALNGVSISATDLTINGNRYTLNQGLLEGENVLTLSVVDEDYQVVFEKEITLYAGSRTIRLAVPELTNAAELSMRADLLLNAHIPARGRANFDGNDLVFRNVPALPTLALVDFPDQGLSYAQAFDETTSVWTLKNGRMTPVSSHDNLDWSNGLAGWTIVSGAKAFRVVKGQEILSGSTGSVSVASTFSTRGLKATQSAATPTRYFENSPFAIAPAKNYLLVSADAGETGEISKTFKPDPARRSVDLSFALRVQGLDTSAIYNPTLLGTYTFQAINSKGVVAEFTGTIDTGRMSPSSSGMLFDQIQYSIDSAEPVEVKIKMTTWDRTYGTPQLIVGAVIEDDIALNTFMLDDGVNESDYKQVIKVKNKKTKKLEEKTIVHPLNAAPLQNISLGPCAELCVYDANLKGYHAIWGKLGFSSQKGATIQDVKLILADDEKELGTAELYDSSVKAALLKTIAPGEVAAAGQRAGLFRFPQSIVQRKDVPNYKVQMVLRIQTSAGVSFKKFGSDIFALGWYPGKNVVATDKVDQSFGGDKWGRSHTFKQIQKFKNMLVTDASNIHGGYFYPHHSHTEGLSFDLSSGYNTDKTIRDVKALLQDPEFLQSVKQIYVYVKKVEISDEDRKNPANKRMVERADAIDKVIASLQDMWDDKAPDGRFYSPFVKKDGDYVLEKERGRVSIFRHMPGHDNHIHVQFR